MKLYPLLFEPNIHTALWGQEEWVVSGYHASPSVIANGSLRGKTLEWAAAEFGRGLMGNRAPSPDRFPLLFKVIDAKDRLSVQVHPNAFTAPLTGGDPKTEMWYVLDREAPIYAGLKKGIAPADVADAVRSGRFEEIIVKHDAKPGVVLFIPGGLVHAIGAGAKVYEVQQSSDTTYRLFDWGRVGTDGKPRTLHIEQSLKSIDFSLSVPEHRTEVECPFFKFNSKDISVPLDIPADAETFRVVYVASGEVCLSWDGGEMQIAAGRAALIPANTQVRAVPEGSTTILTTELGN